jgi:exportin-T
LLVPYLQQVFVPVVMTIFRVLSGPVEANDQVGAMDQTLLRRGYFSFIAALVNNDVIEVLASQSTYFHLLESR